MAIADALGGRVDSDVRIELVIGNDERLEKQRSGRECDNIPGRTPVWALPPGDPVEPDRRRGVVQ